MRLDPEKYHRHSIRLPEYDYGQAGWYFVTVCTHNKECLLGEVTDGVMVLNSYGEIVRNEWLRTSQIRPRVVLHEFVIMPNHFHGIVIITDTCRGTLQRAPTIEQFGKPTSDSIPTIVRLFKSSTTKRINELRNRPGMAVWQRNYYEHVIRDESDYDHIREYVMTNPQRWEEDLENPLRRT